MSDETRHGKEPVKIAFERLAIAFNPPETENPEAFWFEFKSALGRFASETLTDGVTEVIRRRKHRSFPSIGEVHDACMATIPSTPQRPQMMSDVYEVQDAKRAQGIVALAGMPGIERVIAADAHTAGLDFYIENGRLPDRNEWIELRAVVERANKLMAEADSVPEGMTSTWVHITQTAASALRYRRARVAEEIAKLRMKEAAE